MLQLLRRYQSYIYGVVAFVIIISFSFFGTYSTLPAESIQEQTAFTAVDGSSVNRSEVERLTLFLGTDAEDKLLWGGRWGPNFLNDGVIRNDLLSTGLAQILFEAYAPHLAKDLQYRLAREKRYQPYSHPEGKFISVENVWAYFAPEIKTQFNALQKSSDPTTPEALNARIQLYLSERKLPPTLLYQVLRYQQQQYHWLPPDPRLDQTDLSLFGYHTVDEWFGPNAIRLMAEFIINSSKLAQQKGYKVTKTEALADLMHNAEESYKQNLRSPFIGATSSLEYFNEQLQRMGMSEAQATTLWQQVLLFRRLFQDVGNATLLDSLLHQQLNSYATETVNGDLYQLPTALRFNNYRALQKFEIYLDAVTQRDPARFLAIPTTVKSADKVKAKTPELIHQRYTLDVAKIAKTALLSKVGLKEMWEWETSNQNWEKLKQQFPELGVVKSANTKQERIEALDNLDNVTRAKADLLARQSIVDAHPEWIDQALQDAPSEQIEVSLSEAAGSPLFVNLKTAKQLMQWLDSAPLDGQKAANEAQIKAAQELARFTADQFTYYRISVVERSPQEQLFTFAEADKAGILDAMLDRILENHYLSIRDRHPAEYQQSNGSWKPFAEVKEQVADAYFSSILEAIRSDYAKVMKKGSDTISNAQAASLRFFAQSRTLKNLLEQGKPEQQLVREKDQVQSATPADQFKWEKSAFQIARNAQSGEIDKEELFALVPGGWTTIHTPPNGDLYFFKLKQKDRVEDETALFNQLNKAHQLLSNGAQQHYMKKVVEQLKQKEAISLDYLNPSEEEVAAKDQDT